MPRRSIADQVGDEPIDALVHRPSQAKRDRSWEKEHRAAGVVTYRGIPVELNQRVKEIAEELGVPVGEVARALLEYGVQAFEEGRLDLTPQPAKARFSLFPRGSD